MCSPPQCLTLLKHEGLSQVANVKRFVPQVGKKQETKKESKMSFESVWGFDPEEVIKAQDLVRCERETNSFAYNVDDQRSARIPSGADSQIYELRRMYRL